MYRWQYIAVAGMLAGIWGLCSAADAATVGLGAGRPKISGSLTLVRSHGGGHVGNIGPGHIGPQGGIHFHGGPNFHRGPVRYSGHWVHDGDHHHGHRHFHGYPFIGFYGGYPYYNDFFYDDYTDYPEGYCYYSRRYRARICPED